jgi:4-alpha-glucanotransferase
MTDPLRPAADRASGVLLHPTSLPSPFGIGDLGPQAHSWLEWLAGCGCGIWQVLPLGPTGYGDSPYQSFSAMAGNALLISPEGLAADGLLSAEAVQQAARLGGPVDFGEVIDLKDRLLNQAHAAFQAAGDHLLRGEYGTFREAQRDWLDDFALFMALKSAHHGAPWTEWSNDLAMREPAALGQAAGELAEAIEQQRFRQFLFFRQWGQLRQRAQELGLRILGDVPIFVAHDSADVWAARDLYDLLDSGRPRVVAGVPPDYFTETGQLWGNPLYRWDRHAAEGYTWWIRRLSGTLNLVDAIRLDHFRGFEAHWEVPGDAPTAETGEWVKGPGLHLFAAVRAAIGSLPLVAEDLGVITKEVRRLRDGLELPGMKVLQFGFSGEADNEHLPHNYPRRCVAYTGTHDNDTTAGWFQTAPEEEQQACELYLGSLSGEIGWDLLRVLWGSVANWAIAPLQDLLGLGSEGRMNFPGRPQGNWSWRFAQDALTPELQERVRQLNRVYGRLPVKPA